MKLFSSTLELLNIKLISLLTLSVLSFFLLAAGKQSTDLVDSWKDKVLEAHGGVDILGQISTLVFKGIIVTRSDNGSVILTLSQPGKLRVTMKYSKKYEDRILLENKGWRDFGSGFEEAVGHSLDAMIFQYNHLNLPMGLLDSKFKLSFVEQKINGQNFPILELIAEEEPPMAMLIDPKTGLIMQINGKISTGENEVVMGVGYSDYRKVDGVMLPHQIINYVNGVAIAESHYDSVQVNKNLDPKYFDIDHHAIAK